MQEADPISIDWDDLRSRLREAIRNAIQAHADELGISYEACIDRYFGSDDRPNTDDATAALTPPASSR
jgi:hypothetical protein